MTARKGLRAALSMAIIVGSAAGVWMFSPMDGLADSSPLNCAGDPAVSDVRTGEGTIAISNRELVVIGSRSKGCLYQRRALGSGLLRHVAVRRGVGTAYVEDQATNDVLVVHSPSGVQRISSRHEITHPAISDEGDLLWSEDMGLLRLRRGNATRTIARPEGTTAIFAPVFAGQSFVAVVQEPVLVHEMTEDDMLNNLYRYSERGWRKLTNFDSDGDSWSVIRTPVMAPNGDILFVRIHGRASRTVQPRFELWSVHGGRVAKLRDLPGEMYLAGLRGGRLMWNTYSSTCGDWELLIEDRNSGLRHVGCGAVFVDPVNVPDPDLEVEDVQSSSQSSDIDLDVTPAVIVGDFYSRARAGIVAKRVPGGRVVGHDGAPAAVRPGAFVVAIEAGADPARTLREVRRAVPNLKHMVFLAPLGKLGR